MNAMAEDENFTLEGDPLEVGKNFRARNPAAARKGDLYETPYSMTTQLLEVERFSTWEPILEPACGNGAIVRPLEKAGFKVHAFDIATGADFLALDYEGRPWPQIITNPPYSLASEFVLQAKRSCSSKFAFLLPLDYLHGLDRFKTIFLDDDFPLARVWTFVRRPDLRAPIREDGKYPTGALTFAWFIWDRSHRGPYQGGWINNQQFVLKAGKDYENALT